MRKIQISKFKQDRIVSLYKQGTGTMRICSSLLISRTTVQKYLKRNRIRLRKTSPWKNTYNVGYFSNYSRENCYWAGFILADGCIRYSRSTLHIKLKYSDKQHLQKFLDAIKCSGTVLSNKSKTYCYIDISGKWFVRDLKNKYGIYPRKTFTTTISEKIPRKYLSHFVRGIMDGDGCLCRKQGRYLALSFVGTYKVLTSLNEIFVRFTALNLRGKNVSAPITSAGKNIGSILYSCQNAVKISKWIYENSTEKTRLTRKYLRFLNYKGPHYV